MQNQGQTKSLLTLKFSYKGDFNRKICTFYSKWVLAEFYGLHVFTFLM